MVVGLRVDYRMFTHRTEAVENAEHTPEVEDAPIVNVDANFTVPENQRYKDMAFPRLEQMLTMSRAAEKAGSLVLVSEIPEDLAEQRPFHTRI